MLKTAKTNHQNDRSEHQQVEQYPLKNDDNENKLKWRFLL